MRRLFGTLLLFAALFQPAAALAPPSVPPTPLDQSEQKEQTVYGSRRSNVYHRATCRYVRQINPENLISFPSRGEAEKGGYRPCKVCKPCDSTAVSPTAGGSRDCTSMLPPLTTTTSRSISRDDRWLRIRELDDAVVGRTSSVRTNSGVICQTSLTLMHDTS